MRNSLPSVWTVKKLTASCTFKFTAVVTMMCLFMGAFFISDAQRVQQKTIAEQLVTTSPSPTCTAGPCTPAGTIVVDGNPCDWSLTNLNTFAVHSYQLDAFGNGVVDSQFTQGSKDFMEAEDQRWSVSQTKAKNDIANGAAVLVGNTLYFAGDRTSNNGDAQIGFWFYLNGTGPHTRADGTQDFAPNHAVGDLLILADFTGGGRNANVTVYQWVGTGGNVPNTGGTLNTTNCSGIVAENNDTIYPIPVGWTFLQPCYDVNEFYEGVVDLSCILSGAIPNACFSSFLLETRSSQSITASLDDFVSGGFAGKPTPTCSNISINCTTPSVIYNPAVAGAQTLQLRTGTTFISLPHTFVQADAAGTYWLIATSPVGCQDSCSFTFSKDFNKPVVSCSATPSVIDITSAAHSSQLDVSLAGSVDTDPTHYTYSWTENGAGSLSSLTIKNPVYTAGVLDAGGTVNFKVVVTNKTTGCKDSSNCSVNVLGIGSCPDVPRTPVCSGSTNTFTASVAPTANETWVWSANNGAIINPPNCQQSVSVTAGTQNFTLRLAKAFANPQLDSLICTYAVTVNPRPTISCPGNITTSSCQTQTAVNTAFATWLAGVSSSNGTLTSNPASPTAPNACGGAITVIWTVTGDCGTRTCSSTFTVAASPAVSLTCPTSTTAASRSEEGPIKKEFRTRWSPYN